jgi:hypothetical protein
MIKLKDIINESNINSKMLLSEWMTYDDLVDSTKQNWPTRIDNANDVRTVPPRFVVLKDGNIKLEFEFRSQPSREGKSHQGMIKFAPNNRKGEKAMKKLGNWWKGVTNRVQKWRGKEIPEQIFSGEDLRNMKCKVSCTCKDFKYRMEKANNINNASDINFSNGNYPTITNPDYNPGLCKHLLGTMEYLTGDIEISDSE